MSPSVAGTAADPGRLVRATATVSGLTLLSRLTGFVRVAVVVAVLGTTYLGNTYQTANSVPNLLFELFAAGALQAVLVPELVELLDRQGRGEALRIANLVMGALLSVLGVVLVVGWLVAPLVARLLFAGAPEGVRADQVWLGTVFLWLFLPQVLFYALGMVSTAALNAEDRFAVPAVAPLLNNVVVVASYLGFWALLDGDAPSLDLSPLQVAVLAGGTTLGVAVFTSAPLVAAWRAGLRLRPRWSFGDPRLRRIARQGVWAGVFLALTQVLLLSALAFGNTVEGGSVIYQYAYTVFLLPHALVAIPIFTALFPSLSRAARTRDPDAGSLNQGGWDATTPVQTDERSRPTATVADELVGRTGQTADEPARSTVPVADDEFSTLLRGGIEAIAILLIPATVAMIVLGQPAARLIVLGESRAAVEPVAWAMAAFAPGLAAYGIFLLLARAAYAHGDARLPAGAHLVVTVIGITGMVVATLVVHGDARIAGLAGAHSVAYLLGTVLLGAALARRRRPEPVPEARPIARGTGASSHEQPQPAPEARPMARGTGASSRATAGAVDPSLVRPALLLRAATAGAITAAVMATARLLDVGGERATALLQVGVGGAAGLIVYLALMRLLGLGDPRRLLNPRGGAHA